MQVPRTVCAVAALCLLSFNGLSCNDAGSASFSTTAGTSALPVHFASLESDSSVRSDVRRDPAITPGKQTDLLAVLPGLPRSEVAVFDSLMSLAREAKVHRLPMSSLVQWVGEFFVGANYKAGMLDESNTENLVVSFTRFDCVLFVETVLAISFGIQQEDYSGTGFTYRLRNLRYRKGQLDGYESRLHYFADWVHDNESMGFVTDITAQLGGVRRSKVLNIMSMHPRLYPRLAENDSLRRAISQMEVLLRSTPKYRIPKKRLGAAVRSLHAGDIVSTSTTTKGLDVSHSGFAYRNDDGSIGFLHASSTAGKVVVTKNLNRYVRRNRLVNGIVVARPVSGL